MRRRSITLLLFAITVGCADGVPDGATTLDKDAGSDASAGPPAQGMIGGGVAASPLARDEMVATRNAAPSANAKFAAEPPRPPAQWSPASQQDPAPSMVIRTAHASIEVDSLERRMADLRSLAMRVGGWVANTSLQGGENAPREASVEIKIPQNRFDDVRTGLAGIGELKSLNENAQDVGEEYVDIAARVENSKRLESRLVGLLASRTGRLEEVLAVERELARVREEIERAEGRLRYLNARVSFSTFTVHLFEPRPIIRSGGGNAIVEAFQQAWRNFVGFVAAIIAALGVLVPLGGLIALGWVAFNAIRRRFPPAPVQRRAVTE